MFKILDILLSWWCEPNRNNLCPRGTSILLEMEAKQVSELINHMLCYMPERKEAGFCKESGGEQHSGKGTANTKALGARAPMGSDNLNSGGVTAGRQTGTEAAQSECACGAEPGPYVVTGFAQHGQKLGVYSKSNWNILEYVKAKMDI